MCFSSFLRNRCIVVSRTDDVTSSNLQTSRRSSLRETTRSALLADEHEIRAQAAGPG